VTSLGGVLRPPNLYLANKTYRMHGNAATEHVQAFAIGDAAEHIGLFPNIPTINIPSLSAVRVFRVFNSRNPRILHCSSPIYFANVSLAGPSCLTACHGREILSCGQALPAWQEACAKDCLTRPRRVLDLMALRLAASSTKLCTWRLLVQIWYVGTSAVLLRSHPS
jgi:hypothetical protein